MKRLFLAAAIALSFTVCSAETLNVVWGMIDHNGDEFTSQMLENVTFSARISNFGSGYNSSVSSETSPGNSVEVYEGERGVCIIDFSNFTDWEWRSGDELKLLVKNHNPETKAFWREAYASWIIPQNADGLHQFGFEDLGIAGSGDPLSSWADFYYPERNIYIGLVNHNGDIFDFTESPYNRVTFKAWITGRENDTVDQNSSKSGYIQYEELASAIRFDLYDFDTLPSAGETFNLEVIHDSFGLGYYDLHFEGVLGDIQDDEDVIIGLDAWYGTGSGGGSAWTVDNFVEEMFMVTWGMIDHGGNEFTPEMLENVTFSATIRNWSAGYESNVTSESDPGNSVEMFYGIRGVCKIDFNNFTDWEWRSGDELWLLVKDYNDLKGESYFELDLNWPIPENATGLYELGFEDILGYGGFPSNDWTVRPVIDVAYIGTVDHNGDIFDFSSVPYDNVNFKCWISGREDDIIDQDSFDSAYSNFGSLASAVRIRRDAFQTSWQIGDTLNVEITQYFDGEGYFSGEKQYVFTYTHGFSHYGPYDIRFGLDVLYEDEGFGGGDPVVADNWTTGIEENSSMPVATELFQNYPNPFNPVTQIKFALAKSADVKLSVYNISGQRVAELASGVKNAGHHAVDFDGSRLNSGIYYYTLEVDGKAMTKRMVLTK